MPVTRDRSGLMMANNASERQQQWSIRLHYPLHLPPHQVRRRAQERQDRSQRPGTPAVVDISGSRAPHYPGKGGPRRGGLRPASGRASVFWRRGWVRVVLLNVTQHTQLIPRQFTLVNARSGIHTKRPDHLHTGFPLHLQATDLRSCFEHG